MFESIAFKDIIIAIIKAIDLINPILKHHHRRTAIIAYNIGRECGLSEESLANLVVASSLHDIGALTVEDTKSLVIMDVDNPEPHSDLGCKILSSYEGFSKISKLLKHHHIKYSDYKKCKENIPFESLILHLADRVDISLKKEIKTINQVDEVIKIIEKNEKNLFDPSLVVVLKKLAQKDVFWLDIDTLSIENIMEMINIDFVLSTSNFEDLEKLVLTLGRIIDYKSPFTVTHSIGVAFVAYSLAQLCHFEENTCKEIKIAGYLHDIGKIAIPSELISKPGKLTEEEYLEMKSHAYYTGKILEKIKGFENISKWAANHHEVIDGTGYPMKLSKESISRETLILAYADIFTALGETRPYREELPLKKVIEIISKDFQYKLDENIFKIMEKNAIYLNNIRKEVQVRAYHDFVKI